MIIDYKKFGESRGKNELEAGTLVVAEQCPGVIYSED